MRDYAKISPQFWIGSTGRKLRDAGPEATLVALYLLSNPHANMLGLYYLPQLYIAHETGLGIEGASKGLRRAIEAEFCDYDEASEVVFVCEMARFQIAERLERKIRGRFSPEKSARRHKPARRGSEGPSKPRTRTRTGTVARARTSGRRCRAFHRKNETRLPDVRRISAQRVSPCLSC